MSLKRIFAALGLAAAEPRQPPWRGELYDSPLHRWLDAAGFPWRMTRAELAARYGVHADPAYAWPVLSVPLDGLDGLIHPLTTHADHRYPLSVPSTEFTGRANVGGDARANLRHVADQLVPHLGPTRIGPHNNTVRAEWTFGRASLTLMCWPAEMSRHIAPPIEAHERDPRLKASCFITLKTGFRPVATAQEMAWLESFAPIARIRPQGLDTPTTLREAQVSDLALGVVRELPDGFDHLIGQIGLSGDGQALIVGCPVLQIAPLTQVVAFRIDRYRPGRSGPGGSYLMADLLAETPGAPLMPLGILWQGPDTAEQLGEKLAAATGRPLEIVDAGTED